ncbi:MAG: glycosyltransferase [Desulfohalobiaceae bacterium]|nr:glycosyltransferase [Desulfohalobiaceae bacterium]
MLISFIIPCYNEAETISNSLQSVCDEQSESDEVIVVDCGSSDGSLDIIQHFNVTLIHVPESKRSYAKAVNEGVLASSGKYLQIVDSDCLLAKGWVAEAIKAMESLPDLGFVAGTWRAYDSGNDVLMAWKHRATKSTTPFFQSVGGPHLYRREAYLQCPLDEALSGSADVDQAARLQSVGWKHSRLQHPMLIQARQNALNYRKLLDIHFNRYGAGSGEGFVKIIFQSIKLVFFYTWYKKYHILFSATFIGIFFIFVWPILLYIILGIYSLAIVRGWRITGSMTDSIRLVTVKICMSLGFLVGMARGLTRFK